MKIDNILYTALEVLGQPDKFSTYYEYLDSEWLTQFNDLYVLSQDEPSWSSLKLPLRLKVELKKLLEESSEKLSTSNEFNGEYSLEDYINGVDVGDGWILYYNEEYQAYYYYNTETGESQWVEDEYSNSQSETNIKEENSSPIKGERKFNKPKILSPLPNSNNNDLNKSGLPTLGKSLILSESLKLKLNQELSSDDDVDEDNTPCSTRQATSRRNLSGSSKQSSERNTFSPVKNSESKPEEISTQISNSVEVSLPQTPVDYNKSPNINEPVNNNNKNNNDNLFLPSPAPKQSPKIQPPLSPPPKEALYATEVLKEKNITPKKFNLNSFTKNSTPVSPPVVINENNFDLCSLAMGDSNGYDIIMPDEFEDSNPRRSKDIDPLNYINKSNKDFVFKKKEIEDNNETNPSVNITEVEKLVKDIYLDEGEDLSARTLDFAPSAPPVHLSEENEEIYGENYLDQNSDISEKKKKKKSIFNIFSKRSSQYEI